MGSTDFILNGSMIVFIQYLFVYNAFYTADDNAKRGRKKKKQEGRLMIFFQSCILVKMYLLMGIKYDFNHIFFTNITTNQYDAIIFN